MQNEVEKLQHELLTVKALAFDESQLSKRHIKEQSQQIQVCHTLVEQVAAAAGFNKEDAFRNPQAVVDAVKQSFDSKLNKD